VRGKLVDAVDTDDGSMQLVTQVESDLPQRTVTRLGANDLDAMPRLHSSHITSDAFTNQ